MQNDWLLDPEWTFLNHGSFGARLKSGHAHQDLWRARLEQQPLRFFLDTYGVELEAARAACAAFIGASPQDTVFVPNATYGVNSVLQSWPLQPGDEILVLDHAYGACRAALNHRAAQAEACVRVVTLPLPCVGPERVVDALLEACTPRTRFAMLDAVTSPTAWVLPVAEIVKALKARGVETLVDAAHTPGMLPMDVAHWGAAYTTGNLHKWVGAPLGAAFLHVRPDHRGQVLPSNLSHGLNLDRTERWRDCFDWTGTFDPSAWLTVPFALKALNEIMEGGSQALMTHNQAQARRVGAMLSDRLGLQPTCPESMLGSMVSLFLPLPPCPLDHHLATDPLQRWLGDIHRIEVPILTFGAHRLLRVSCHHYNKWSDYVALADALQEGLALAGELVFHPHPQTGSSHGPRT